MWLDRIIPYQLRHNFTSFDMCLDGDCDASTKTYAEIMAKIMKNYGKNHDHETRKIMIVELMGKVAHEAAANNFSTRSDIFLNIIDTK